MKKNKEKLTDIEFNMPVHLCKIQYHQILIVLLHFFAQ